MGRLLRTLLWNGWVAKPYLTCLTVAGIAVSTGLLLAMLTANKRAVASLESSSFALPATQIDERLPRYEWRLPGRLISVEFMRVCMRHLPRGVMCRGFQQVAKVTPGGRTVNLLGIDGDLLTVAAPLAPESLLNAEKRVVFADGTSVEAASPAPYQEDIVVLDFHQLTGITKRSGYQWLEVAPQRNLFASKASWDAYVTQIEGEFSEPVLRQSAEASFAAKKSLTSSYRLNLYILSATSMLVAGLFLWSLSSLQLFHLRRKVGVLRKTGASHSFVLKFLATHLLVTGMLGAIAGIFVGIQLESFVSAEVVRTIDSLYVKTNVSAIRPSALDMMLSLVSGLSIYLGASYQQARRLLAVDPATVGGQSDTVVELKRYPLLTVALLAIVLAGPYLPLVDLSMLSFVRPQPVFGYLSAFLVFFLIFLASPWVVEGMSRLVRWADRLGLMRRLPGMTIASRRLWGLGRRNQAAVCTLSAGLCLVFGISIMVDSFRYSLTDWFAQVFSSRVVVTSREIRGHEVRPRMTQRQLEQAKRLDGVRGIDCQISRETRVNRQAVRVFGAQYGALESFPPPLLVLDKLPKFADPVAMARAVLSADSEFVFLSEPLVSRLGVQLGDEIVFDFHGRDPARKIVAAVVRDYSSEQGYAVMNYAELSGYAGWDGCHAMRLYTDAGDISRVMQALRSIEGGDELEIKSTETLRQEVLQSFEDTFAVTSIMILCAALLGVLSILLQLSQSMSERVVDWMALRRVGASYRQLWRIAVVDSIYVVLMGLTLGTVGGIFLGRILVVGINRGSFGWSIDFSWWRSLVGLADEVCLTTTVLVVATAFVARWLVFREEAWRIERE